MALEVFRESLDVRSCEDYDSGPRLKGYQCGSLKFGPPRDARPRAAPFHIANAIAPTSIFHDRTYLPQCFLQLMDMSEAEYGANEIATATWLNSYPRWLELFPRQWVENMGPVIEIDASQGLWGQFINARGLLNVPRANKLRQTGRIPLPGRPSWCTIAAMRAHLREYLK